MKGGLARGCRASRRRAAPCGRCRRSSAATICAVAGRSQREAEPRLRLRREQSRNPRGTPASVCSTMPLAVLPVPGHVGADVDLVQRLARDRIEGDARAVDERRLIEPRRLARVVVATDRSSRPACRAASTASSQQEPHAVVDVRRALTCQVSCAYHSDHHCRFWVTPYCWSRCTAIDAEHGVREREVRVERVGRVVVELVLPVQLPPRASLFSMYSKWPPSLRCGAPRVQVMLSLHARQASRTRSIPGGCRR